MVECKSGKRNFAIDNIVSVFFVLCTLAHETLLLNSCPISFFFIGDVKVAEIETLLNPNITILPLSTTPPTNPPPSGTLLLYNRSTTRNYKDDGYKWIKKRNSHKVREDHVKLRVGGKYRVSGKLFPLCNHLPVNFNALFDLQLVSLLNVLLCLIEFL